MALLAKRYNIQSVVGRLALARQLFAYKQASLKLPTSGVVLDVGSSLGHGIKFMSKNQLCILSMDLNKDDLQFSLARNLVAARVCGSGEALPFGANSLQVVTSFQVIEHVYDIESYLCEIRRVLHPEGKFILSTPNKLTRLLPGQRPFNTEHLREYDPEELRKVLSRCFSNIEIFGVFGIDRAHEVELARVEQNPFLVVGTTHWSINLPSKTRHWLGILWRKFISRKPRLHVLSDKFEALTEDELINQFTLRKISINNSLDLFAIAS